MIAMIGLCVAAAVVSACTGDGPAVAVATVAAGILTLAAVLTGFCDCG